ncbi:MAG: PD40 domain-containing protein [Spirochaetales bacterium]|nr:PD40 domain-containing protein [Spirochaetales bacterium]
MKNISISFIISLCLAGTAAWTQTCSGIPTSSNYPQFSNEQQITIDGYTGDAMEPFISSDGNYLFFNSLNDGITTSLYYAEKSTDTLFVYKGEVNGVNGTAPHLDAVASMDNSGNFYFVSTRNYPAVWENLQAGSFSSGTVENIAPVPGDFYIRTTGWIIMDAEISRDGNALYFVNAQFTGQPFPEESKLGIAEKTIADFTLIDSTAVLKKINNSNFLVYAPSVSSDGLELYFTRIKKGTTASEICVSVRKNSSLPFAEPVVLDIAGNMVEAPSISADGNKLYYHKKSEQDGKYLIYIMERAQ